MSNIIRNGGFRDITSYWQAQGGAQFAADQGHDQLGAAYLPGAGAAIFQEIALPDRPNWTLAAAFKAAVAGTVTVTIANDDGQTIYTADVSLTGGDWDEWTVTLGLPADTITITITYGDVAVYVDDVSAAHIPKTRYQLAVLAHAECQDLTGDISTFTAPSAPDSEGSYTAAIDAALLWVGAVNEQNAPDVRWLDRELVGRAVDKIVEEILTGPVLAYYQKKVDVSLGPRRESYSQIANGIRQRYGLVPGATHSGARRMMVIDMVHNN